MRCEEIQERLSAYLDAEVESAEWLAIENHLESCERCRREMELLHQTISPLHALEEVPVSANFRAKVQRVIEARSFPWWRRLARQLFVPIHIKLPLEAMTIVLVTLGAVYLYRSTPELAKTPQPQAPPMAEQARRGIVAPSAPGEKRDRLEGVESKMAAEEAKAGRILQDKEQDEMGKKREQVRSTLPQRGAPALSPPAPSAKLAKPIWELRLKTDDPSRAAARLAEIVPRLGGELLRAQEENQILISLPAEGYPKFLEAVQELGSLTLPLQDAPPPSQTLTISLRLIP